MRYSTVNAGGDASPLRAMSGQRWFIVALVAIFGFVAVSYAMKAAENRSAFLRWRSQVLTIDSGADIYQRFQYPNPPIMAMILRPFAEIEPPIAGALGWFAIKLVLAALSLAWCFRIVEHGGATFPPWAKAAATLLVLRPIIGDLTHGNVNILILFLVTAALFSFHRGRDFLAGVLLALAICCKVTPLLFVPYFAWKRQWRVLFGATVGMVLFLFVIPSLMLGWADNLSLLNSWTRQMILPFVRDGVVSSEHPNQSLPGVIHRLLTPSPSFSAYPDGVYTPTEFHHVADIGRDAARWIVRLAQVAFLLGILLLCRARERGGWRVACEFAFVLVGMLILSERTWKHHCVTLALPAAVLAYAVATQNLGRWVRTALIAGVALAICLMMSASSLLGKRGADLAQVYGVYLGAFVILIGALAFLLARARHGDSRSKIQAPAAGR